jgi:DNA-binding NarL/FixJ family response regulator
MFRRPRQRRRRGWSSSRPRAKFICAGQEGTRFSSRRPFGLLQADDAAHALALCQSHNPALVLLGAFLPGLDSFAAAADIRRLRPGAKIAILTRHNDIALFQRARRARLNGFILKQDGFEELHYAIRTMLKGGFYAPPSMSTVMTDPNAGADPIECLTEREKSTFTLYAQGYVVKEIAGVLNISVKTGRDSSEQYPKEAGHPKGINSLAATANGSILVSGPIRLPA